MIKSLTITNDQGDVLYLELARPEDSGFAITSITGLDPGDATIQMTEIVTNDGAIYNYARRTSREIVLTLRLLWNPTIEDARQQTYKYFPLKSKIQFQIETDNHTLKTEGYVKANTASIFSKAETSTITILCEDPNFYLVTETGNKHVSFSSIQSLFEFPFSNDSLTDNLLEFGSINEHTENLISYEGDVSVGCVITIHALGPASNVTLYNLSSDETMAINSTKLINLTEQDISAGDTIVIDTRKGRKRITLNRAGNSINILNCLDKNANWIQLYRGDNIIAYTADSGLTNLQFSVDYQVAFEGV